MTGHLPVGLIVTLGAIAGVVALNLCLGLAWFIVRRRRRAQILQSTWAKENTVQPLRNSHASSRISPHEALPPSPTSMKEQRAPTYMDLVLTMQNSRRQSALLRQSIPSASSPRNVLLKPHRPTSKAQRMSREMPVTLPTEPKGEEHGLLQQQEPYSPVLKEQDVLKALPQHLMPLTKPKNEGLAPPGANLKRGISVRSADSESLYSVASAPRDNSERTAMPSFQPWALETIPASPTLPTPVSPTLPTPPPPVTAIPIPEHNTEYVWPNRRSIIRTELAPETYSKLRWKTQPELAENNTRPSTAPNSASSHSPVSPSFLTRPPSAALRIRTHTLSLSDTQTRSLHPYANVVSPSSTHSLASPPESTSRPEVPPRSPLRA